MTIRIRFEDENGEWIEKEIDPIKARIGRQRRRVFAWCEVLKNKDLDYWMITLTYRTGEDFGLRDITDFIRRLRRRVDIKAYTWVMEMQRRGVPHYHLIVAVRRGVRVGKPDRNGLWNEGMTQVEKAKTIFYVAKYAGKEYQKVGLPKYFHMYAVWICDRIIECLDSYEAWNLKKSTFPLWLVRMLDSRLDWMLEGVAVERCRGGGWWVDNMKVDSPYVVVY